MTKLPVVSGKDVIKALNRAGFYIHHQKDSHVTLRKKEDVKVRVVVSLHRVIKRGTLRSIIKDAGLSVEEFIELLRG